MRPSRVLLFIAFLSLGWMAGCERNSTGANVPASPPPPQVTAAKPIVCDVTQWDDYTGRLQAIESVEVKAQVSGFVKTVNFTEGSIVKKGDVLLTIDPSIFQSQLDNATGMLQQTRAKLRVSEATLQLAQNNLKRAEDAAGSGGISPEELDTARYTVAQDQAAIAQDQASIAAAQAAEKTAAQYLGWCQVTAPIGGRISDKRITVGNLLTGGSGSNTTVITTITSLDPIYGYFDVDEAHVLKYQNRIREDSNASVTQIPCYLGLLNEQDYPHTGTLDFIDNAVNPATGTLRERGVFPNPDGQMIPGMFARIRIAGDVHPLALLVLDQAVGTEQNLKYLYVLHVNNTVERRIVTVGPLVGMLRVITSNLEPDDLVLINGLSSAAMIRPESTVSPTIVPMPERPPSPLALPAGAASVPGTTSPATSSEATR